MASQVYKYVTERIVALLEKGTIPWRCPWIMGGCPINFKSKKAYRGVNVFLLAMAGYASPYWLSRKQINDEGGTIRKGEKSTMVTFFKFGKKDDDGKSGPPIFRYYLVWNVEQTTGIDYPMPEKTAHDPIDACDAIVAGFETCPPITHKGGQAVYSIASDTITMPPMEYFAKTAEYYSTLFHECAHATGHPSRLDRDLRTGRHSDSYAFEELIAEMTAAMLCGQAGIEMQTLDNSAAYIANWLRRFKDDPKMVVQAASKAQKAADCILGYSYESDNAATPKSDSKVAQTVAA